MLYTELSKMQQMQVDEKGVSGKLASSKKGAVFCGLMRRAQGGRLFSGIARFGRVRRKGLDNQAWS